MHRVMTDLSDCLLPLQPVVSGLTHCIHTVPLDITLDVGHYPSVCVVELAPLGARDDLEKAWRVLRRKTDWLI